MSVQQWVTPLTGLESLRQVEVPMPAMGRDEVLVEIHAVSLNYRDVEGELQPAKTDKTIIDGLSFGSRQRRVYAPQIY